MADQEEQIHFRPMLYEYIYLKRKLVILELTKKFPFFTAISISHNFNQYLLWDLSITQIERGV